VNEFNIENPLSCPLSPGRDLVQQRLTNNAGLSGLSEFVLRSSVFVGGQSRSRNPALLVAANVRYYYMNKIDPVFLACDLI